VTNPDLTIITSIDIDHSEYLGNTREKIAIEKAGIMRKGVPCLCGDNNPPFSLIEEAKRIEAPIEFVKHEFSGTLSMSGTHQRINAQLAFRAAEILTHYFPIKEPQIINGLQNSSIIGRQQKIHFGNKKIILDVAHNPASVSALCCEINKLQGKKLAIFSALKDKDINLIIETIDQLIYEWYIFPINTERGLNEKDLLSFFGESQKVLTFKNMQEALTKAISNPHIDNLVVFGSFHVVGDFLKQISSFKKL